MTTDDVELPDPSGSDEFDRARTLLRDQREDEALDWFELALERSDDAQVKTSAAAHVGALLLGFGRPWEVATFAAQVRELSGDAALGNMLEAAASVQLGDFTGALQLLGDRGPLAAPSDRWFPCSIATVHVTRIRALHLAARDDEARAELACALDATPDAPEVWETVAAFVASGVIDASSCVARLDADRVIDVFAWMAGANERGLDEVAEELWRRSPGDARVLAAATLFAWRLEPERGLLWSARLLEHEATGRSPLLERAEMPQVAAADRVRAAVVGVQLDEPRARRALEAAASQVEAAMVGALLGEVLDAGCGLADSFVVSAASSTARCLSMAVELCRRGHGDEALAVLVAGLSLPDADDLTAAEFDRLVPEAWRHELARIAYDHDDEEVAGILLSVPAAG